MNAETITISDMLAYSWNTQEQYKTLRANLEFCTDEPRVVLVTSSIENEGKTTVAVNLSYQLATAGYKVLLMDCDLRKSVLAANLGIAKEDRAGLTEVLLKKETLQNAVRKTEHPNLYILLPGTHTPNPVELMSSLYLKSVVAAVRKTFDYIILDCPPVGNVIDAAVLSAQADGVLFVIGSDMVNARMVRKNLEQLNRAGGRILGTVLNKIESSNRTKYDSYTNRKYKYYGYGEEAEGRGRKSGLLKQKKAQKKPLGDKK